MMMTRQSLFWTTIVLWTMRMAASFVPMDHHYYSGTHSSFLRPNHHQQKHHQNQRQPKSCLQFSTSPGEPRRPLVVGNWKLNPGTIAEASQLLQLLQANFLHHRNANSPTTPVSQNVHSTPSQSIYSHATASPVVPEVVVLPPFPFLLEALLILQGTGIHVGAQGVSVHASGPYTGEVSASMVRSIGVQYVLLGASESRNDATVQLQVQQCLQQAGLGVIVCVGENAADYKNGLSASILEIQVRRALQDVKAADLGRCVLAYEPVWANTATPTPQQAQQACGMLRQTVAKLYGDAAAAAVRIQYAGSVRPETVASYLRMTDVDGVLIGDLALEADAFTRIVDGATL